MRQNMVLGCHAGLWYVLIYLLIKCRTCKIRILTSVNSILSWNNCELSMHAVFYFIQRADEYAGGGGEKTLCAHFRTWLLFSFFVKKQMKLEVSSPFFFCWINSSQIAITSHQQVSFTSPLIIFSPCAPTSASPVTTRAPAVPIVTSLNLQLCAVLNHSNWSPACDSHVIGSVSRYRHTHTHTHKKPATEQQQQWSGCEHNTCANAPACRGRNIPRNPGRIAFFIKTKTDSLFLPSAIMMQYASLFFDSTGVETLRRKF